MATNTWTADRRLYLDKNGAVVEADDPTRQSLLVTPGNTIPLTEAVRLGLVAADEVSSEEGTGAKKAPANKRRGPSETKEG